MKNVPKCPKTNYVPFKINHVVLSKKNVIGDHKLVCPKCDKEFGTRRGLTHHMQLHTGQFRYFCDLCRKGYNGNHALKVHMDKHRGIKYQCEFCPKTFTSLQKREYHTSVHTGNYRFNCDICNKGFNEKDRYLKHVACHT